MTSQTSSIERLATADDGSATYYLHGQPFDVKRRPGVFLDHWVGSVWFLGVGEVRRPAITHAGARRQIARILDRRHRAEEVDRQLKERAR